MKILNRNVPLKHLVGTIEEINLVAGKLGIKVDIIIKSITNWLFHVDVMISIIVEGDDAQINEFDKLIK